MIYVLIAFGVVILLLIFRFFRKVSRVSVFTHFRLNYNIMIGKGLGRDESLMYVLNFFRYRHPFNQLSDSDVLKLLDISKKYSDPLIIGYAYQICENNRDVSLLKSTVALENFIQIHNKLKADKALSTM